MPPESSASGQPTNSPSGDDRSTNDNVSYESYQKAVSREKAAKQRERELADKIAQLEAERQAEKDAQLAEQQKFKELWEKSDSKSKELEAQLKERDVMEIRRQKRDAVASIIGPVQKPEFLNFLQLDNVDLSDPESIEAEATRFKSEYPMVLKTSSGSVGTHQAPGNAPTSTEKPVSKMSDEELDRLFSKGMREGVY